MRVKKPTKLEVLTEIENQLNQALQNLVLFSIEPKASQYQFMLTFFSEIKALAVAHHFRELGYICLKNEEFIRQNEHQLLHERSSFIKLAKGFGEITQCLKNLLAVATCQECVQENSVCQQARELISQNTQNDEISSLALGRVLVLDDEMLVLNVIESVLRNRGYDVWITNDADQALEILRAHEADILILDLVMPGKSGIEFYRELKQEKIVIPTIVLTASDNKDDHVLALREGIDDFLKKPFEAEVLVANVEKLIKRAKAQKRLSQRWLNHSLYQTFFC